MKKALCAAAFLLLVLLFTLSSCSGGKPERPAKDLVWAIGTELPTAEDFFDPLAEEESVGFVQKEPFAALTAGENEVELWIKSQKGGKKKTKAKLTLIHDTVPPTIEGAGKIIAYIGEGISYRAGITLTDNCGGAISLEVDSSQVDLSREGEYPITYLAIDAAGNRSTAEATLHLYLQKVTREELDREIDAQILSLGLTALTRADQIRAIYQFVHTDARIVYTDESDKTDWVRAAYFCLRDREGDCFSYFSLSKAFFERLGIENLDIQRTPGYTKDTHYWSMVNLAKSGEAARWYHYDATRLRDVGGSGALLTDRQVDAFCRIREYFYLYDRSLYPASSTVELTSRPDLEPYYN